MKAAELMVGDWVCLKDDIKCELPLKIDGVLTDDISLEGEGFLGGAEGLIRPIPITPEILEKNGFSPETFLTAEWEKEVYFKEFPGCVVEPDNSGKYIFGTTIYWNKTDGDGSPIDLGTMYESMIHNLQYVHELQRALRLCGLNELADNFKV